MKIVFTPELKLNEKDIDFLDQFENVLTQYCKSREDCADCPFHFNDGCCKTAFFDALDDMTTYLVDPI